MRCRWGGYTRYFGTAIEDKIVCVLFEVLWVVEVVGLGVPHLGPLTGVRVGAVLLVSGTVLVLPPDSVDIWDEVRGLHAWL